MKKPLHTQLHSNYTINPMRTDGVLKTKFAARKWEISDLHNNYKWFSQRQQVVTHNISVAQFIEIFQD
jgi:hypothetical protein